MPLTAPYGSWKSPIYADLLTEKSLSLAELLIDHASSTIYWVEGRPYEGGRNVPVVDNKDVIPAGWNARTRVHEYGGAAVAVHRGVLYFADFKSNRVYRVDKAGDEPVPVTPDNDAHRFGDFVIHPTHPHILVSILEDHTKPAPADVINTLVCINTTTSTISTLAEGADFYASPTISPDGKHLAWVQWSHPNMPWEASQVYIAEIAPTVSSESGAGALEAFAVSGPPSFVSGSDESSVSQPLWASNSSLTFLYDIDGFYNPWVYDLATSSARPILPAPIAADFAGPAWQLGMQQYDLLDQTTILAIPIQDSNTVLTLIDIPTGKMRPIASPYVDIKGLHVISATEAIFVGAQDTEAPALVKIKLEYTTVGPVSASFTTLKQSSTLASTISKDLISATKPITLFADPNRSIHALYTAPKNPDYVSDGQEKPPCIVNVHGGPTSRAAPGLHWTIQYFTSRGWAFVDVNYGGSSGYGKGYRDRLRGNWGIVDVDDCVAAVRLLGEQGIIDPQRAAIRGGSAGGFTVLASLVKYPSAFAAGNSFYGVSDLAKLSEDTHKFESRYLEKLVGGTIEEVPGVYKDRSPLYHAEKIKAPLLILQGTDDAVVPPNQAELMVKEIRERGGRVKYVLFEGEGHGWRKAETIKRAIESELAWYEEVFALGAARA